MVLHVFSVIRTTISGPCDCHLMVLKNKNMYSLKDHVFVLPKAVLNPNVTLVEKVFLYKMLRRLSELI